ncbi:LytTR family DNA-binding domain-containing protein [Bifidobacterium amazonense]|uniref:LytTR family DNA-binding domain-containing protein n=1 Tax=Bifidobacterium amazonense TaxID=2809027 RepID=A0ABS9VTE8_9BIFI|nr:LytTR family DNA-binding domain-containing protein [Bifidobacterium amazonense]MCH9275353.1 LytTR family DNA-binding domain-containing protein [Bifidobacterium amazonense]
MREIRIGVVEDDPAACQRVLDYLKQYQSETGERFVVSVFDDGAKIVESYAPVYDILLLDIEMKELDGMAAARRIRERDDSVVIIFITAAPQYAISGYEVQALSYLLKPVPWFAFKQEMKRSIDMVRRRGDQAILIDAGGHQQRLELADVVYVESIRHTIVIHTLGGKLSVTGTLKDYETRLAEHDFFRSNSCYLVNLRHVTGVEDQDCIMSDGERLRVSRPRKKAFLAALADYMSMGGATRGLDAGGPAAGSANGVTIGSTGGPTGGPTGSPTTNLAAAPTTVPATAKDGGR